MIDFIPNKIKINQSLNHKILLILIVMVASLLFSKRHSKLNNQYNHLIQNSKIRIFLPLLFLYLIFLFILMYFISYCLIYHNLTYIKTKVFYTFSKIRIFFNILWWSSFYRT